jgi:hypothetical protein
MNRKQAIEILNILTTQDFANFYENEFNDFLEGETDSNEECLEEIMMLFRRVFKN